MNTTIPDISGNGAIASMDEILKLQQEHPYFSVPFILEQIHQADPRLPFVLHRFNINPVLFHQLRVNYADSGNKAPKEDPVIIEPLAATDYYASQGIKVSTDMPEKEMLSGRNAEHHTEDLTDEKSLLVQMSFEEWLYRITEKRKKEKEELMEQEALKLKWKQQKLAEAIQEENDDIPEEVFQMAVNSIEPAEELASESLAEVYAQQGKTEKAIAIYRKLILTNPDKKVYFADKIQLLSKDI